MTAPDDIRALLCAHLADPASQWNLGTFGAIAEFMHPSNETIQFTDKTHLLAGTTARGSPLGRSRPAGSVCPPRRADDIAPNRGVRRSFARAFRLDLYS